MSKYANNKFTGSNVSIFIGQTFLSEAYAISIESSDSKRPVYGYRSVYPDAFTDGQKLVTGQIVINYVHSSYLPVVLQRYAAFKNLVLNYSRNSPNQDVSELFNYIRSNENTRELTYALADMLDPIIRGEFSNLPRYGRGTSPNTGIKDTQSQVDKTTTAREVLAREDDLTVLRNRALNRSNTERTRALDQALNYIFTNGDARNDLINIFTGGVISGSSEDIRVLNGSRQSEMVSRTLRANNSHNGPVERNVSLYDADNALMALASPMQFGRASDGVMGIDIMVVFGNPKTGVNQNLVYNYQGSSGFVIKDARFIGESTVIQADDGTIQEVYSFMARKKIILDQYQL